MFRCGETPPFSNEPMKPTDVWYSPAPVMSSSEPVARLLRTMTAAPASGRRTKAYFPPMAMSPRPLDDPLTK